MVSISQLLQKSGIAELLKRKQEAQKAISQYKITEAAVQPQQVSQADIAAQKKYEADLAAYNRAVQESAEWRQAEKIFTQHKRYDPRSSVGRKIDKLYKNRELAMKDIAYAQGKAVAVPTAPSAIKLAGADYGARIAAQAPGTYDPVTSSYISPEGIGMSMAQVNIPAGTKIVGAPSLPSFDPSQLYRTSTAKVIYEKYTQPKIEQQQFETQRYKDLGYTSSQAQKLATASLARGGVTFTPEYARQIIKPTFGERVTSVVKEYRDIKEFERRPEIYSPKTKTYQIAPYGLGVGGTAIMRQPTFEEQKEIQAAQERGSYERTLKPVLRKAGELVSKIPGIEEEIPLPIPRFVWKKLGVEEVPTTGVTYLEAAGLLAKGVEWVAETAAEGWEDIYETTLKNIPKKSWPGKWIGGEYEVKPKKGTQAWADAIDAGKVIPITKEQVGMGFETAIKGLTYAVPVVGPTYMVSEVAEGVQAFKHPEKEAERIFEEEVWKPYSKEYDESKKTLEEGYELEDKMTRKELEAEYLPGIIEQVKTEGAVGAGISLAFLGTIGAVKGAKFIKKTAIPRAKYLGMTESNWEKHLKDIGKSQEELIKIEKETAKIAEERFKYTRGEVGRDPLTGKQLPQTTNINFKEVTKGLKLTGSEKNILSKLIDKMQVSVLTEREIKLLKDVSKGRVDLTMQLPEKFLLMKGSLGDIPKVVEVPSLKYSPWIGKSKAQLEIVGAGIKGKSIAKQFKFLYQKGVRGKPLKSTTEFQIVTTMKEAPKLFKIDVIKEARKRVRRIKTLAGDVYVSYDSPLKQPGSTMAKIGKSKVIKLEDGISIRISEVEYRELAPFERAKSIDFLKKSTEEELGKLIRGEYSKEELKALFEKGRSTEKQRIVEIIKDGKVVDNVKEFTLQLQKNKPELALKVREFVEQPYTVLTVGKSRGVAPFQMRVPEIKEPKGFPSTKIKKPRAPERTPFSVVPEVVDGKQAFEMKQVISQKDILREQLLRKVPSKVKFYPEKIEKVKTIAKPVSEIGLIGIPRMVGGAGEVTSEYWGAGTYEVAEIPAMRMPSVIKPSVILPTERVGLGTPTEALTEIPTEAPIITREKIKLISVPKVGERFKYETDLGLKRVGRMEIKEIQIPREELRGLLIPRERLVPKERLIPRELLVSREVQVPRETIRQFPILRPIQIPRQVPRPIPKLRPPRIFPRLWKKAITPSKIRKPVPEIGYTYEVRRKGKWERAEIPFAFATEMGAEARAQEKVLGEAAASYRIVKAKEGKKVVRTGAKLSPYRKVLFRPGKEKGVMVQKKLLRILTPGEKEEISYAGGIAKMKKSQLGFFKQPTNNQIKRRKKTNMAKKKGRPKKKTK